jgi:hypothetical protein
MRRTLFALAVFTAAALLLTATSCEQRTHVLRVVHINGGMPVYSDIADWFLYNDPAIPDSEEEFQYLAIFHDDTAQVEFQYVEVGAGLPTWTPYHVTMYNYTVYYRDVYDTTVTFDSMVMPMTLSVPVDREGKKTVTTNLVWASAEWKQRYFQGHLGDAPDDGDGFFGAIEASVRFTGYDSVSSRKIESWAHYTVDVSDFWDDPAN